MPLMRDGNRVYVSGQISRVGDIVVVTGAAGKEVSLSQAPVTAKVCAMRALALLQQALGFLEHVEAVLRICVYLQSAQTFTQQSEVADAQVC